MSEPEPATTARRLREADVQHAADVIRARQQVRQAASDARRLVIAGVQHATFGVMTSKGPVNVSISGPAVVEILGRLAAACEAEDRTYTLGLEAMGITAEAPEGEAASHAAEGGAVADPS